MWQPPTTDARLESLERLLHDFFKGVPMEGGSDHRILHLLVQMEKRLMSALTDLQAAIGDLKTQLDANNTEIEALLVKISTPGTSDADIAAATQSIRDLIAGNKAEVDKAVAATA